MTQTLVVTSKSILDRFDEEVNPINKLDIMKVLVKYKVTDAFGKTLTIG